MNLPSRQPDDPPDEWIRFAGVWLLIAGNLLWPNYPWWASGYCWAAASWMIAAPDTFFRFLRKVEEGS